MFRIVVDKMGKTTLLVRVIAMYAIGMLVMHCFTLAQRGPFVLPSIPITQILA